MKNKKCTKCNTTHPATTEYFYRQKNGKHGLSSRCKACRKQYHKSWHNNNKESENLRSRKYYRENRQHLIDYNVKYCLERRHSDPVYRTVYNLRRRINMAIKNNSKASSSLELIGCSVSELKSYLEK